MRVAHRKTLMVLGGSMCLVWLVSSWRNHSLTPSSLLCHDSDKGGRGTHFVVSYSLYGDAPRYTDGALANAELMPSIYPGWEMRVYYDETVPQSVQDNLNKHAHVRLVRGDKSLSPMLWRFQVASDACVDRYIVRDVDSRLSLRERAAVDEWMRSGLRFHVMRDHPSHTLYFPMSGGMWGGTKDAFPQMSRILKGALLCWKWNFLVVLSGR